MSERGYEYIVIQRNFCCIMDVLSRSFLCVWNVICYQWCLHFFYHFQKTYQRVTAAYMKTAELRSDVEKYCVHMVRY